MTLCAMTEGTSCGIPDFRSRGGLYAQLASSNHYDLDDPQQMSVVLDTSSSELSMTDRNVSRFDINYFRRYPDGMSSVYD